MVSLSNPSKLIFSIFSPKKTLIFQAIDALVSFFGPLQWQSIFMPFEWTDYYEREFGKDLKRCFVGFMEPVYEDFLIKAKKVAIEIEEKIQVEGKRLVNIDPGAFSKERLVLATRKNYVHRILLGDGVYADLTYIYTGETFRALSWTYPDYSSPDIIFMWNNLRKTFLRSERCQEA